MPTAVARTISLALVALTARTSSLASQEKQRPIDIDAFEAVKVVSDAQISPNGAALLYAVRTASLAQNSRSSATFRATVAGGAPVAFPDASTSATEARWSPDGKRIAYIAGEQLWIADQSGGARKQITTLAGGATGPIWSPSGDRIAFTSRVYPACTDDACNVARQKVVAADPVKAHIADQLMYRHWNQWDDGTRAHLFVVGADGSAPVDLTPGVRYDIPPGPFGGSEGYAWAPDGRELAYSAKDSGREDAWSTDINVYTIPAAGGKPTVITVANMGADENPVYSPDGKYILYHSQARAGFESDRWRLMAYDRTSHQSRELLPQWDRNADGYAFIADGHSILIQTTDASRRNSTARHSRTAPPASRSRCFPRITTLRPRSITLAARSPGSRTPPITRPRRGSRHWAAVESRGFARSRTRTTHCSRSSSSILLRTTGSRAQMATACRG